ncbi:MAG: hypothetical protein DRN31_03730 [Thermoplasmata archaeon]|nr:MAG: hypothetical protein DRN31_03730 [Thermoplasmata archaeon]
MKVIFLSLVCMLFMIDIIPISDAGECEYGTVQAWARTLDENGEWGEWQNATVHAKLKVHEPFQVKVRVTSKVDCKHLYVSLERAGNTASYEVVEGPSKIMDYVRNHDVPAGWSKTYEWTVRPTGNWTDGIAALNIGAYFYKVYKTGGYYDGDEKIVDFTVIAAYISSKEWHGSMANEKNSTPAFGDAAAITSFALIILFISKWRRYERR